MSIFQLAVNERTFLNFDPFIYLKILPWAYFSTCNTIYTESKCGTAAKRHLKDPNQTNVQAKQ